MFTIKKSITLLALLATCQLGLAQTVADIITKNQVAEGADARKKFNSVIITGTVEFPQQNFAAPRVSTFKRPNKARVETELMKKRQIQATDGKNCWMLDELRGKTAPESMDKNLAALFQRRANIDGMLSTYADKGMTATLLGKTSRNDSTEVYSILLKSDAGFEITYDIDAKTHLIHQTHQSMTGPDGKPLSITVTFSDYRSVQGVMYAFRAEQNQDGREVILTISDVKVNQPILDAYFSQPDK